MKIFFFNWRAIFVFGIVLSEFFIEETSDLYDSFALFVISCKLNGMKLCSKMQQGERVQVSFVLLVNFEVLDNASAIKFDLPAIHSILKLKPITFSLILCNLGLSRSSKFLLKMPNKGL